MGGVGGRETPSCNFSAARAATDQPIRSPVVSMGTRGRHSRHGSATLSHYSPRALRASQIDADNTRYRGITFGFFSICGPERKNSGHPGATIRAEDAMRGRNARPRPVWGGVINNVHRIAQSGAKIQFLSLKNDKKATKMTQKYKGNQKYLGQKRHQGCSWPCLLRAYITKLYMRYT